MAGQPSIVVAVDRARLAALRTRAGADRWQVSDDGFRAALERSAAHAPRGVSSSRALDEYLESLHLEDLALACACAEGIAAAWDHFIVQFRPILYRAADALQPGGGARDLADGLYAELFGLSEGAEGRRSLFGYYHGRSSLATWMRAVLAQRYVDRHRAAARNEPLDDESPGRTSRLSPAPAEPGRVKALAAVMLALRRALAALGDKERLRLALYYRDELTLAQIGRLTGEHEATVSRHLSKTRARIRQEAERALARDYQMSPAEVASSIDMMLEDPGPFDLRELLSGAARKDSAPERST